MWQARLQPSPNLVFLSRSPEVPPADRTYAWQRLAHTALGLRSSRCQAPPGRAARATVSSLVSILVQLPLPGRTPATPLGCLPAVALGSRGLSRVKSKVKETRGGREVGRRSLGPRGGRRSLGPRGGGRSLQPGGSVGGALGGGSGWRKGPGKAGMEGWPRRRGGPRREPHAGAPGVSSHRSSLHWRRGWGGEGANKE